MKETCAVINKSDSRVMFNTQVGGSTVFYPSERKPSVKIAVLQELIQQPGGIELFYNYLYIDDRDVLNYLIHGDIAPEYWITEENVADWMETCSLDAFKDALDFAPDGTKDLIKKYAVEMPLNDYSKRKAIKDQLGFDVTTVIENSGEDVAQATDNKPAGRRVAVSAEASSEEPAAPKRRVVVQDNK